LKKVSNPNKVQVIYVEKNKQQLSQAIKAAVPAYIRLLQKKGEK